MSVTRDLHTPHRRCSDRLSEQRTQKSTSVSTARGAAPRERGTVSEHGAAPLSHADPVFNTATRRGTFTFRRGPALGRVPLGIDDKEVTEQVTEAQVRAWCLENNQTLITTQSLEMDLRRRLASRTQYLPIHKSVADQFVTANLANTPLEFCTYLPPSTAHAPKILCAICVRAP